MSHRKETESGTEAETYMGLRDPYGTNCSRAQTEYKSSHPNDRENVSVAKYGVLFLLATGSIRDIQVYVPVSDNNRILFGSSASISKKYMKLS